MKHKKHFKLKTDFKSKNDWTEIKPNLIKEEKVNHPKHYGGIGNTYESIKVIEAWDLDFCLGNTVKYISRAGKKDDIVQDLEKAAWYLNRKIEQLKNKRDGK